MVPPLILQIPFLFYLKETKSALEGLVPGPLLDWL